MKNYIFEYLQAYQDLLLQPEVNVQLCDFAAELQMLKKSEHKILLAGNGASASISSHLATDFTKQAGIRAMTFNDANLITALGNDCGYDRWVSKALEMYANHGDLLVLISSSGKSPNILQAAKTGRELGLRVVSFTGFEKKTPLGTLSDLNFWVDSRAYNIIECVHMIWLTAVCDMVIGKSEYSVAN